jgi:YidC/Oxa1 family membrane protein insertase
MTVLSRLICCLFGCVVAMSGEELAPAPAAPAAETLAPGPSPDAGPAAMPAAPGAPQPAPAIPPVPASPRDDFATVTIANPRARVTITTQRAAIVRFELLDTHPVSLPEPLRRQMGLPKADQDQPARSRPLAVLDNFRRDATHLDWNHHNLLTFDNRVGPTLDGTVGIPWTIISSGADRASFGFTHPDGTLALVMSYAMDPSRPSVVTTLRVHNVGSTRIELLPRVLAVNGIHQDYAPAETQFLCGAYHSGGDQAGTMQRVDVPDQNEWAPAANKDAFDIANLDYVAVKSRFFAVICAPVAGSPGVAAAPRAESPVDGPGASASAAVPGAGAGSDRFRFRYKHERMPWTQPALFVFPPALALEPGAAGERSWSITASGMRNADLALLTPAEQRLKYTDGMYRFFKVLADALIWCLTKIWLLVRNYGVAVIVLTVLLKALLHRTTFKQQASLLKMQKLAPEMKFLQERHKNDKQKLGLETMALYKKHGVNPLSGCLPMFIQLPMFMALYQAFNHSADMRGQSFLWINDLTLPDQVWAAPVGWLSWLTINPLALLYIGVTVWMSFSTKPPPASDPQQEQMQKMMRWLPVIFGVIFYNMPAGLVLYFTVNAILSTIEIKLVKRKLGMT